MNKIFGKILVTPSDKRKPSFAGSWYEADSKKLRFQLGVFLDEAGEKLKHEPFESSFVGNEPVNGTILAAIAPHAGYMFSGPTAGFVYESLKKRKVTRVFLLGPSHYIALHGCALPVEKIFSTPVGDLRVDTRVVNELKDFPLFKMAPEIHKREHSLEMQLPFIRESLGDVTIVPIIVGSLKDEEEMRLVGHLIKRYLKDGDAVLVSSDFTHYGPRYDFTPFPTDVSKHLRELDEGAFQQLHKVDLPGFIEFRERTRDTICGYYPCAVLLSMLPPQTHATLLRYQTSSDVIENSDENSVSYLAVVFSNKANETNFWQNDEANSDSGALTEAEQDELLELARAALTGYVQNGAMADVTDTIAKFPRLKRPAGAFVTLYKKPLHSEAHKELRGCIGYIFPVKSLAQAVVDNAIGAASKDPRFTPVDKGELNSLQIDINVLTPPVTVGLYREIRLGQDGVIMYKADRQAVFLPSVATEFGWTLEEMLSQLSIKASCGKDGWQNGARFEVFQAQSFLEKLAPAG